MLLGAAALVGGSVLWRMDPALAAGMPPCPFRVLTGLYCPGCGSTRCLSALLHGDLATAMAMNPLLVAALPLVALMALNAAGWRPQGGEPAWRLLGRPTAWLWTLLGYAVLRNLPWWPFVWLAPG